MIVVAHVVGERGARSATSLIITSVGAIASREFILARSAERDELNNHERGSDSEPGVHFVGAYEL
jgi:hypothetical protein